MAIYTVSGVGQIIEPEGNRMPDQIALPAKEQFPNVLQRTLELTGGRVSKESVGKLYKIFKTLRWDFPDYEMSAYTVLDADGGFGYAESIEGSTGRPDNHGRGALTSSGLWPWQYGKDVPFGADQTQGRANVQTDEVRSLAGTFSGQLPGRHARKHPGNI